MGDSGTAKGQPTPEEAKRKLIPEGHYFGVIRDKELKKSKAETGRVWIKINIDPIIDPVEGPSGRTLFAFIPFSGEYQVGDVVQFSVRHRRPMNYKYYFPTVQNLRLARPQLLT